MQTQLLQPKEGERAREREFFFYYVKMSIYHCIIMPLLTRIVLRFYFLNSEENPSLWT